MIVNTFPTEKKKANSETSQFLGKLYLLDSLSANENKPTLDLKVEFKKFFSEFVHLYCHHWEISRERCSQRPGVTTAKGTPSPCPQTAGQVATSLFHRKRGVSPTHLSTPETVLQAYNSHHRDHP